MNSELKKELEDAAFPFDWSRQELEFPHSLIAPTLSALIKACGDRFCSLNKLGDIWDADTPAFGLDHDKIGALSGETPEEAVARLWLALNKKPV